MVTRVPRSVTLIAVVSSNARSLHEGRAATAARATIMRARPRASLESPARGLRAHSVSMTAMSAPGASDAAAPFPVGSLPAGRLRAIAETCHVQSNVRGLPCPLTTNRDSEYLGLTSLVEHRRSE